MVNGGEGSTGTVDGEAPTVSLDNPVDGATIPQSDPLVILGLIWDEDQDAGTLGATIVSSRDGGLWEGSPDEFGRVELETTGLSVGQHTIASTPLTRTKTGAVIRCRLRSSRTQDPRSSSKEPGDGDWFWNTDTIRFVGSATDDIDHPQDLIVRWSSSIDGIFSETMPNPTGATIVESSLSAGFHTVGLTAVDTDGNETTYNVTVEVRDPLDHDGDLDGFTENEGDCNDADPYTHPDAEEACDARDNDCDGDINEDDWDDLEFNDTLETATDLGDIDDAWIFGSPESGGAGITRHAEYDEAGWCSTRAMISWSTTSTSTCPWGPSRSRVSM